MVRRGFSFLRILLAFLSFSALAASARDYKIGDTAETDVLSPERLTVVDAEATDAVKDKEAQRIPVIYRYYPRTINEVEATFHSAFTNTRSNFLAALDETFHQRSLSPGDVESPEFQQFIVTFQKQNLLLPVGTNLAALWAGGESDENIEAALTARLRETMKVFIRSDVSPPDIRVGSTLRLVSWAGNEATTAQLAAEHGSDINKTNFVSLPRLKTELQNAFPPEDRAVGRYLATLIRPNCQMEADLTRELRAKRTDGIVVADHYDIGQPIVRRGQTIDKKALTALNLVSQIQLKAQKEKAAAQPAPAVATVNPPVNPAVSAPALAEQNDRQMRWFLGALGGIFVMLLAILWLVARRRPAVSLLPVRIPGGALERGLESSDEPWQQRALQAEERVRNVQAAARAGLISQLAHWLSAKLTRRLVSQRAQLLDAHQSAALEIAEIEARLEKIHAPLQERLQAYERRIAELEKELSVKGEENRELIKAKIEVARKQLEIERGKSRLEFN